MSDVFSFDDTENQPTFSLAQPDPALAATMQAGALATVSPEEASRAVELSQVTGAPPQAVLTDVKSYGDELKRRMSWDLIRNSPELQAYVNSHPLAAAVSNDDWGVLGNIAEGKPSSLVGRFLNAPHRAIDDALSGAAEGFGSQPLGQWLTDPEVVGQAVAKRMQDSPATWAATSTLLAPFELMLRGGGGAVGGITGAAYGAGKQSMLVATGDPKLAESFGREMAGVAESELFRGHDVPHVWSEAGVQPPRGVHPELDAAKATANATGIDAIAQAMQQAQASATRARNPQMFENFAREVYGDQTVGLSAEAAEANAAQLSWLPDFDAQLELSRETGTDVQLPVASMLTKADPALGDALREEGRFWPGGVTAREAAEAGEQLSLPGLDTPLAQARHELSAEPLFEHGDRPLELAADETGADLKTSLGETLARLNWHMEGDVVQLDGLAGEHPASVGPSAISSLLAQMKDEFPEAKGVAGPDGSMVKFSDGPAGWGEIEGFQKVLNEAWRKDFGQGVEAYVRPTELYSQHEAALAQAIRDEVSRITGGGVEGQPVDAMVPRYEGHRPRGVYLQSRDRGPQLLVDLFGDDPIGVARHEGIHYLKAQGLFTPEEWSGLEAAAKAEDWQGRYGIGDRYGHLPEAGRLEEAVAEAFRDWASTKDTVTHPDSIVTRAFQKLWDFLKTIKDKFTAILGREPRWDELFEKAFSGELAERGGKAGEAGPKFSLEEAFGKMKAETLGLDEVHYQRLQRLTRQRYEEDLAAEIKRQAAIERKRQSADWAQKLAETKAEVEPVIKAQPEVAADLALTHGEYLGQKLPYDLKIARDDLTTDEAQGLSQRYISKTGEKAADVASLFGFQSRDEFIDRMVAYRQSREGRSPREHVEKLVNDEAQRLMEQRHGNLDDNIMSAAREQALTKVNLDLMSAEMEAVADMAKVTPIGKAEADAWVESRFNQMSAADVSSERFAGAVGKAGRDAERALIDRKFADAAQALQKKYLSALMLKRAKNFEADVKAVGKLANRYRKAVPKSVDAEAGVHIQQLLKDAGFRVKLTDDQIDRSLEIHGTPNLTDYNRSLSDMGYDPVISEALQAYGARPVKDMTVGEFNEFRDAIKSLDHIGRDIGKVTIAGERAEWAAVKQEILDNLRQRPIRPATAKGGPLTRAKQLIEGNLPQGSWLYNIDASLMRPEKFMKELDLRRELGPLFKAVIAPLELSKAKEFELQENLADHLREGKNIVGKEWRSKLNDSIENNLIRDPYTSNRAFYDMTRENLIHMMLNWGSQSNIEKLADGIFFGNEGRRASEAERDAMIAQLKTFIDKHATKEDWDFVQHLWKPFKDWQPEMDVVAHNTTGVVPKWIPAQEIDTPFGKYEGGYWPVNYDRLRSNINQVQEATTLTKGLFGPTYFKAATAKSRLKSRTSYVDFVDLTHSIESAIGTMQQTMHDIAFRDSLMQASKIFNDKEIRGAIRQHYGSEYEAQLTPWLQRISMQYSMNDRAVQPWNDMFRRLRINLVSSTIPWNIKHWFAPYMGKVSPGDYYRFMANYGENMDFALEKSKEMQHLVFNMNRDYNDAMAQAMKDQSLDALKTKAVEIGYKPLVFVEKQFRASTFWNEYMRARAAGRSDSEAVLIADSAVRERHGGAHTVDMPSVMTNHEYLKILTMMHGYYNTMYNMFREIPGDLRTGDYGSAWGKFFNTAIVSAFFSVGVYSGWTEKEGFLGAMAKNIFMEPMKMVPGLGDMASLFGEGFEPRNPLTSATKSLYNVAHDAYNQTEGGKQTKLMYHASQLVGAVSGVPVVPFGRAGQFIADANAGKEAPKNIYDWMRGMVYGTIKPKKE